MRLLFVFAALLLAALTAAAQTPAARSTPPGAPPGNAANGRKLFVAKGCFECHGNEAQGGVAGPRLGPGAMSFARLSYVRKPTGDMPPYTTKVLSERDLADIYAFLESVPKPPPVSAIPLLAP
jgi:ubiquinol-cytochrome c reductase cytochrome c subunit